MSENNIAYSDLRNARDDIEASGASITYSRSFDTFEVTSITALAENTYDHWEDADATREPFLFFRQKSDTVQISQEIRLVSTDESDLQWIAGIFAFSESAELRTSVPLDLRIFDIGFLGDSSKLKQDNTIFSPFAQLEYGINDELTIIGGGCVT